MVTGSHHTGAVAESLPLIHGCKAESERAKNLGTFGTSKTTPKWHISAITLPKQFHQLWNKHSNERLWEPCLFRPPQKDVTKKKEKPHHLDQRDMQSELITVFVHKCNGRCHVWKTEFYTAPPCPMAPTSFLTWLPSYPLRRGVLLRAEYPIVTDS